MGCYSDSTTRDLPYFALSNDGSLNVQKCILACRNAGYRYAGVQSLYIIFIKNI